MVCIYCFNKTEIINSRLQKKTNQVWRRRHCTTCNGIFTTLEQADLLTSLLYKNSSGRLESFQRDILFLSVFDSLGHRKTASSDATALTATILSNLSLRIKNATLERSDIVNVISAVLKRFDKAAAITYSAYHPI
jgi:transcriptional repressor NrdR